MSIKDLLVKFNDLSTSLQDIIMRKITWDMLSTSMKDWLKDKEERINSLEDWRDSGVVEKAIDDFKFRLTILEAGEKMDFTDCTQGQFAKFDLKNRCFYGHDGFMKCRVVENEQELLAEFRSAKPLSMKTIFNTWQRYTHYNSAATAQLDYSNHEGGGEGQNLWNNWEHRKYLDKNSNGWVYEVRKGIDTIAVNRSYDDRPTAGFVNPTDYYTNYYLRCLIDTGWDDDNLFMNIGFMTDANGVEHTLSVVRGAGLVCGGIDTIFWWGLIYDMGNSTQVFLRNLNKIGTGGNSRFAENIVNHSPFPSDWAGRPSFECCYCYITVIRSDDEFEIRTTEWSKDGSDTKDMKDATFFFKLPDTIYDKDVTGRSFVDRAGSVAAAQAMWNNIWVMLKIENRVGFGVRSGAPSFAIVDQRNVFDDGDIYALHQDTVYTYNANTPTAGPYNNGYVVKGKIHDLVSNHIFMYHPRLKKLVFYHFWNKWVRVKIH